MPSVRQRELRRRSGLGQELHRVPEYSEILVIIISAGRVFRQPLSAKAFIPKPLDVGVLLETIERFLFEQAGGWHGQCEES